MGEIRACRALLKNGWAENVKVTISESGLIESVEVGQACIEQAYTGTQVGILVPAPVNAHSHVFQRAMAGLAEAKSQPRDNFWSWRDLMYRFLERLTPEHVQAIAAFVQMEMLEAGFSTNVEFHYLHHQSGGFPYSNLAEMSQRIAAAAADSGIGLTLLPVYYRYGGCKRRPLQGGQLRFKNNLERFGQLIEQSTLAIAQLPADCVLGIAAHSLRAIDPSEFPELRTMKPTGPFHMHLAEQVAEVEEIRAAYGVRPVEWVLNNLDPGPNHCFIHCTQMTTQETNELARSGAVAGLCPITEANLGDGIFNGVQWIQANGRFAIGSDSNVRISLAEELRTLEYSQRLRDCARTVFADDTHSTGRFLFDAIVQGGAAAAGRATGTISPSYYADLLALDEQHVDLVGLAEDKLLDGFLFTGGNSMVKDVWAAGRHLVQNGRHISRDRIEACYRSAIREMREEL